MNRVGDHPKPVETSMCTNIVDPYLDPAAEMPVAGLNGNQPAAQALPVAPGDHRIHCMAHVVGHNRMMVGACGPEQTKITYTLAEAIARHGGLTINSVTTNRAEGAAGSFFVLSDVRGHSARLGELAADLTVTKCFDPHGVRVVPEKVFDLRIIGPDRCNLLRDALRVISVEYGINIETMVNRTFRDIWQDELNTLDETTEETAMGTTTRAHGGEYTGLISVTQMRLEVPAGTNVERLKRDLEEVDRDWDITWTTPRLRGDTSRMKANGLTTRPKRRENPTPDSLIPRRQ